MGKARTGGPRSSHRAEGALFRAPPGPLAPENAAPDTKAGLPALFYWQNSLYNSMMHTWAKAGSRGCGSELWTRSRV